MLHTDKLRLIWNHFLKCYAKRYIIILVIIINDCWLQIISTDILKHLCNICLFLTQREYVKVRERKEEGRERGRERREGGRGEERLILTITIIRQTLHILTCQLVMLHGLLVLLWLEFTQGLVEKRYFHNQ